ncbi:MAG: glycosyltransferase family 4 protein [Gemmatimonadaceae bacterium]
MRIVVLSETFSKTAGYISNMLPRFLARTGAEVHLVTMNLPPYYQLGDYRATYSMSDRGRELRPGDEEDYDGYRLHVLDHEQQLGYMRPRGLLSLLRRLAPEIVQAPSAIAWLPLECAWAKAQGSSFRLFTASHSTKSTFTLAQQAGRALGGARLQSVVTRGAHGRLISLFTTKCYCPTSDCAEIAWRYFGVQRKKVSVMSLGVDVDTFSPVVRAKDYHARACLRRSLGFQGDDIVCVYSGKLTETKNALVVSAAVARLRQQGLPYRALVIGNGAQRNAIAAIDGTVVLDFMPHASLAQYYRASDIGVWPTNESTSTLDAAACGLPLIISDGVADRSHVAGNGLTVRQHDIDDLMRALVELAEPALRRMLGSFGAEKMAARYSWAALAQRRVAEYESSLRFAKNVAPASSN